MPKPSSKKENSPPPPELTKYQKYEKITINRQEIKNAPYNPRRISDTSRKKLKAKIEKIGLINAPVWNRQTGNLVGGHQRLSIIDSLERSQNYLITVDAVDVDLKTEKEMNVFLNNASAQGEFDLPALEIILADPEIDLGELGFDHVELSYLKGDNVFSEEKNETLAPVLDKLDEIKAKRKRFKETTKALDDEGFYVVLVFQDRKGCDEFVAGLGYPAQERYVDGNRVADRLASK